MKTQGETKDNPELRNSVTRTEKTVKKQNFATRNALLPDIVFEKPVNMGILKKVKANQISL